MAQWFIWNINNSIYAKSTVITFLCLLLLHASLDTCFEWLNTIRFCVHWWLSMECEMLEYSVQKFRWISIEINNPFGHQFLGKCHMKWTVSQFICRCFLLMLGPLVRYSFLSIYFPIFEFDPKTHGRDSSCHIQRTHRQHNFDWLL